MFILVCLLNEKLSPEGTLLESAIEDKLVYMLDLFKETIGMVNWYCDLFCPKFSFTNVTSEAEVKELTDVFVSLVKVSIVADKWVSSGEIVKRECTCGELLGQHVKLRGPHTDEDHHARQHQVHNATPKISHLNKHLLSYQSLQLNS